MSETQDVVVVTVHPGQTLQFVVEETVLKTTPFGISSQTTQKLVPLTYEQIIANFQAQTKPNKSQIKKVPSASRAFNRFCSLSQTALETGYGHLGAAVEKPKVAEDLVEKIKAYPESLYYGVTEKSKNHLRFILNSSYLTSDQKNEVKNFLSNLT